MSLFPVLISKFNAALGIGNPIETRYEYDGVDNLTSIESAYGTADAQRTEFEHDANGNRTTLRDAMGNETIWAYDALNRPTSETILVGADLNSAVAKTRSWQYDKLSLVVAYIDRNERLTMNDFDVLGRQTGEKWYAAGDTPDDHGEPLKYFSFSHDALDRTTAIEDSSGADYQLEYDALGRLGSTYIVGVTDTSALKLVNTYNETDQRTKLQVFLSTSQEGTGHADLQSDYGYDGVGRLKTATQWSPASIGANPPSLVPPDVKRLTFSYDIVGQMTRIDRSTGDDRNPNDVTNWSDPVSSAFEYDAHGRLVYLGHSITSSIDDTTSVIESYAWQYDERHRLTVFASLTEGTTEYGYDEINQLKTVDRPGTENDEEYDYDANGNRTSSSSAAFTSTTYVTALGNRLTSDGTYDYEYDAEGNRTKRTTIATGDYVEYVWDHRNRLTEVIFKNAADQVTGRVEYAYDPFNHRVAKTVYDGSNSVTLAERYLYDGNSIIADLNPDGTVATAYFVIGGTVYAQQRAGTDQPVLWLLQDQLGSTRQVVESDGNVVATYSFDSFGNILASSTNVHTTNILWTGLRYIVETGTYIAGVREYVPTLGRWMSVDWIEDNLNNNYGYVANGPTNAVDPSGMSDEPIYHDLTTGQRLIAEPHAHFGMVDGKEISFGVRASDGVWVGTKTTKTVSVRIKLAPGQRPPQGMRVSNELELLPGYKVGGFVQYAVGTQQAFDNTTVVPLTDDEMRKLGIKPLKDPPTLTDKVQEIVDWIGMIPIPILGEACDLGNAAVYALRGKYAEAGQSCMGALPSVLGSVFKGGSKLLKGTSKLDAIDGTRKAKQAADAAANGSRRVDAPNRLDAPTVTRPTVGTSLPGRVTGELPQGAMRTPAEVKQARNFFERNRDAARQWWEQRTGQQWPDNATHYEHPRALKDGGDPLFVEPGYNGPNAPHMVPGPDGLTDFQRWGQLGGRPKKN